MSSLTFLNYFFPAPPEEWEMEDVRQANALSKPFYDLSGACGTIGFLGTIFATLGMAVQKIRGQVIKSKLIYLEITCIALMALGIAFHSFGRRHYQGLTEERETELALKEFKQGIDALPVCQSQAELDDKLANDPSFTSQVAKNAIESANEACNFARVYYRPTKDLQPRFKVSRQLTMDQQLDLLDCAYEKGIILHFEEYEQKIRSSEGPQPLYPKEKYSAEIVQKMEDSFACSIKFLVKHLQPLDSQKLGFINAQLRALSFKWIDRLSEEEKAFYPRVYLEDDQTIVIRGNFSDSDNIDQIAWAIESLVPHINAIKIEGKGLDFLLDEDDWRDFKNQLNTQFPGKMIFVNKLSDHPSSLPADMDGIWQKNPPQEPTIIEKSTDQLEDMDRRITKFRAEKT